MEKLPEGFFEIIQNCNISLCSRTLYCLAWWSFHKELKNGDLLTPFHIHMLKLSLQTEILVNGNRKHTKDLHDTNDFTLVHLAGPELRTSCIYCVIVFSAFSGKSFTSKGRALKIFKVYGKVWHNSFHSHPSPLACLNLQSGTNMTSSFELSSGRNALLPRS